MLADEFLAPHAVARWATERPDAIAVERIECVRVGVGFDQVFDLTHQFPCRRPRDRGHALTDHKRVAGSVPFELAEVRHLQGKLETPTVGTGI